MFQTLLMSPTGILPYVAVTKHIPFLKASYVALLNDEVIDFCIFCIFM